VGWLFVWLTAAAALPAETGADPQPMHAPFGERFKRPPALPCVEGTGTGKPYSFDEARSAAFRDGPLPAMPAQTWARLGLFRPER